LENDFVDVEKVMILRQKFPSAGDKGYRLDDNNEDIINAQRLWDDFHSINGFADGYGHPANQWKRKTISGVPFSFQNFLDVRDNVKITDTEGNDAKIESLRWNPSTKLAEIKYRYREIYTQNLQEEQIIPDGR
jgi:hypothetical protein